jgi:fibrillarin-like pre-rRNA processing protein
MVYGEKLVQFKDVEYRSWVPYRSKLAAAILNGCAHIPIEQHSRILYLGAANGTTVSHLSDIVTEGLIYAVDISPRAMRDLVQVSTARHNIIPILGDANRPEDYLPLIETVDMVYQDISQRNQVALFIKNMVQTGSPEGILMVKTRSIDVKMSPQKMFSIIKAKLLEHFGEIRDAVSLHPYEKAHFAIFV